MKVQEDKSVTALLIKNLKIFSIRKMLFNKNATNYYGSLPALVLAAVDNFFETSKKYLTLKAPIPQNG